MRLTFLVWPIVVCSSLIDRSNWYFWCAAAVHGVFSDNWSASTEKIIYHYIFIVANLEEKLEPINLYRERLGNYFGQCRCVFIMSIEDHPLLWMVVRSQTYYPKHILAYGSGKTCCSLIIGSGSFRTNF